MSLCVVQVVFRVGFERFRGAVEQAGEDLEAAPMVARRFAVFQRQIEEDALVELELRIEARVEPFAACFPRELVRREHVGRSPKHVPRELIQHDDVGKSAPRRVSPSFAVARRDRFVVAKKVSLDRFVDGVGLRPPSLSMLRARTAELVELAEPEIQNVFDLIVHVCASPCSAATASRNTLAFSSVSATSRSGSLASTIPPPAQ